MQYENANFVQYGKTRFNSRQNRWYTGRARLIRSSTLLPPATKLGQGNIFRSVCPHSVHRGGMHGCSGGHVWLLGGHAWLLWGACMVARGACMVAWGHAWLLPGGVCGCSWGGMHGCSQGGMHGCSRGHAWLLSGGVHGCSWGACMVAPRGVWLLWGHAWLLQGGVWLLWRGVHGI